MFTGLIQDVGEVVKLERGAQRTRLTVRTQALPTPDLAHGESVAVDGCCLSVVDKGPDTFTVEVSPETLRVTALSDWAAGTRVNLERALRLSDRLGGHLVLGHVDGVGTLESRAPAGDFQELWFTAPPTVAPFLLPKGSVAIDGISLTVNRVEQARFSVMLIPETIASTGLRHKSSGARVNLEGDVIGKYVARLLAAGRQGGIDLAFLKEHGFA